MSGKRSTSFIDFTALSFEFDRVCCALARSFLVRNWCDRWPSVVTAGGRAWPKELPLSDENPKSSAQANASARDPKKTSVVRRRLLPPTAASPRASAAFARSDAPITNANPDLACGPRAALHVIDEGSQLRHDLSVAGIVEEHTRRHRRELLQHGDEFSRRHGTGGQRCRHLRKTHTFDGCAEHRGKVVGDERSDTAISIERPLSLSDHDASAPFDRRNLKHAC